MKLYQDKISGRDLCTDSYRERPFGDPILDQIFLRYEARVIKESESGQYDIGGNPSAECGDEDESDVCEKSGPDICLANHLDKYEAVDKKTYMAHLKKYFKKIYPKETTPAEKMEGAKQAVAYLIKNIGDADFYIGEGLDPLSDDCMLVPLIWDNDDETGKRSFFIMWRDGLEEVKL